eukprot:COSAG01_NODE_160_length_23692_cov_9.703599_3_plen_125_part_00
MRALGIHVVPYVNGRLFDPSIFKWSADAAWNHMCNSSNGPYHLRGTLLMIRTPPGWTENCLCFVDAGTGTHVTARRYREVYHTTGPAANISFYIADPADGYWQDTFAAIARQLKDLGVDGLYGA